MSLQVWLPLNGDLHNQGLSDVTVTGQSISGYSDDGKIGKALTLLNSYYYFTVPSLANATVFSCAFWYKRNANSSLTGNWRKVLSFNTSDGTTNGTIRFESSFGSSASFMSTHSNAAYIMCPSSVGNRTLIAASEAGTWHHLTVTFSGDVITYYVDGVVHHSGEQVAGYLTGDVALSSNSGVYTDGLINDLRIYDHCLSPKEVKELSKGLIAHYPLNDGVGGENIFRNTGFKNSNLTTYWNDEGGFGISIQDGELVIPYKSGNNRIYYNYQSYRLTANTDYVLSFDARASADTQIQAGRWTDAGYGVFDLTTKKKHYSYRINTSAGAVCFGWSSSSITHTENAIVYLSNIKLELGTKATPWIPNPNDELYSAMGLDNGICYDTSGYGHNGEYHNTTKVTTDAPRYSIAPLWESGVANNVTVYDIQTTNLNTSFTVSCWAYLNGDGRMPWCSIGGNNLNLYVAGSKFYYNTFDGTNNPFQNGSGTVVPATQYMTSWHHYTVTGDGTTAKLYVDGVYLGSAKTWKPFTATGFSINGPNNANYKVRSVSDLRIYATALSAEDIKQLYEVSASIDNTGNVYGSEVVE